MEKETKTIGQEDAMSRLGNILSSVTGNVPYGEILQLVLEATGSRYGFLGYVNENSDLVVPIMTKDIWEKCQIPDKSAVFKRAWWGDSIWARALKQRETLFSNETSQRTPKGHIPVTRSIAAPIVFQGQVIGLLHVANKDSDYLNEDIGVLNSIAATLAPLLQNRLEEQ